MKKLCIFVLLAFVLSACSKTNTVSITYESNGGTMQKSSEVINSDSKQWYPPVPQKANSLFVNWYLDQTLTELYTSEALLTNTSLTLYAKYIAADQDAYYIISFISVGGTYTPNQLIASGEKPVEPAIPMKEGYKFMYWEYVVSATNKQGALDFDAPITEHLVVEAVYRTNDGGAK